MASTKIKVAYAVFLISFGMWLALFLAVWFPSITSATPIRFPNTMTLTTFMAFAVVAAISCGIIGMDFLGINLKLTHTKSERNPKSYKPILQESPVLIANTPRNVEVAEMKDANLDIFGLLLTEEEEIAQ
jgi:hypothetical protein